MLLQPHDGIYTVAEFMTRKADLLVVETSTPVDKGMYDFRSFAMVSLQIGYRNSIFCSVLSALEILVEKRITGFPVVDADWNLVCSSLGRVIFLA